MTWFKVDDGFHSHRKAIRAGVAAVGLWTLAGSWASDQLTDGWVPDYIAMRYDPAGWEQTSAALVRAGLWEPAEHEGEQGWWFHDWLDDQPSRTQVLAERKAAAERQQRARERARARRDAERDLQSDAPVTHGVGHGGSHARSHGGSHAVTDAVTHDEVTPEVTVPPTRPDPTRPVKEEELPDGSSSPPSSGGRDEPPSPNDPPREDVERICAHLADWVARNGSKRPAITKTWRDAARRMLDRDERTVAQVIKAIDWCQSDEFWRSNVMSMPTLREKYDQLRLQASRGAGASRPTSGPPANVYRGRHPGSPNPFAKPAADATTGASRREPTHHQEQLS